MAERVYTALFPFGGMGGGAMGFAEAETHLFGTKARFVVLGGIDSDAGACADFEKLARAPSWCTDIDALTPADLRARWPKAPDVVFFSPPCKGASGLLSAEKAKTEKYQKMNGLAERWTRLMLEAWREPPRLVLLENVPRLKKRAAPMLRRVRAMLRAAGYVFHDGFHECGEIGGLAQVRKRYLLVARHAKRVPPLLYQPPKLRVRGCGEVIGPLPMPSDPAAGPMHRLPRLSWLNWVRLALIPAGGDWRDLNGVLRDGQAKREVFKRHGVQRWDEPSATVAGSGSNGPSAVADPRIGMDACGPNAYHNNYRVEDWAEPAHTVTGATRPGSGGPSVADPRVSLVPEKPAFDHGYGVLRFDEPSPTVAGGSQVGQGAYSVADARDLPFKAEFYKGTYGVMGWEEAAGTITGAARFDTGRFTVADPRKPPDFTPLIIAADGTWHRPLTTLELAVLQSFPATIDGEPLVLSGKSHSAWRERIGNAVPRRAARAIAERMLVTLLTADCGGFTLEGSLPVWVRPETEARVS